MTKTKQTCMPVTMTKLHWKTVQDKTQEKENTDGAKNMNLRSPTIAPTLASEISKSHMPPAATLSAHFSARALAANWSDIAPINLAQAIVYKKTNNRWAISTRKRVTNGQSLRENEQQTGRAMRVLGSK